MVDIEFDLNQTKLIIQASLDDPFQKAIVSYLDKSKLESGSIYFLANGRQVNPKEPVKNYMGKQTNKKLQVLVYMSEEDNKEKDQVIIKSGDIICPTCKEPCRMTIENYRIKLFGCITGHVTEDIKITDFAETQKVNISKIVCDKCKIKNRGNCPKNDFYKCLSCQQNLCLLCKPSHNSSHNVIRYSQKNYICPKHNEALINYCKKCKKNICFSCVEHKNHESVFLGNLMPDMEQKKKILKEIKSMKDTINIKIQEIIEQLLGFIEVINHYYDINNDILNNFDIKNRNYQNLENLNIIDNNNIIYKKLKEINKNPNIKDIIDLYKIIEKGKEKKISASEFKEEELNDPDCISCLNTLTVLNFKLDKYEKIRNNIDGRTPKEIMQKIVKMRVKINSLENSLGSDISPKDYEILLKFTLEHDTKLLEYFEQIGDTKKSMLVCERIPLIVKELEELMKVMPK